MLNLRLVPRRLVVHLMIAATLGSCVAVFLPGCNILRRTRRVQAVPPPPFNSPIAQPVGGPGMTTDQIRQVLGERRSDIRSLRANLTITVGEARSNTRQQFDASVYSSPPGFLRVRGSADAGALFDFLMDRGRVQVMVVPEKKVYIGSLAQLRTNTSLMAGIQPDDLMNSFLVEQNLYRNLRENPATPMQETQDHYEFQVVYPGGLTEVFQVRKTDLLVDKVTRTQMGQTLGLVNFYGYQFYGNHLLPSRFDASLANGGQATVEVVEMRPNEAKNAELNRLTIPDGYERLSL